MRACAFKLEEPRCPSTVGAFHDTNEEARVEDGPKGRNARIRSIGNKCMTSNPCTPNMASKFVVMKFPMLHHSHASSRGQLSVCRCLDGLTTVMSNVFSLNALFVSSVSSFSLCLGRGERSKSAFLYKTVGFFFEIPCL